MLVREGLAKVDEYNPTAALKEAESAAKRDRKNVNCRLASIKLP